jgi:hypothetical protein
MPDQIHMPESVRKHLKTKMIGTEINGLTIEEVIGSANTAVTYQVREQSGVHWALKLVTRESYGDRAPFREVARFAGVEDERFLALPKEVGDYCLKLRGKAHEFIWFKSRLVGGCIPLSKRKTLKSFLKSGTEFSPRIEILKYLECVATGLEELQRLGFAHGDLHDRNIMRELVGGKGKLPEVRYVIIDFSEAHPIEEAQEGLEKDILHFGQHLRGFYDAAYRQQSLKRDDEKILAAIAHIPGLVNGTAAESMGISTPWSLINTFQDALASVETVAQELSDPFRLLSADYIADHALLAKLCCTKMWWTPTLEEANNVLLMGPRGCGKTMIFRRLRFKTKVAAKKTKEIEKDNYIAFYLPCESLFYMRFSDLSEVDIERNKDALLLFFNMAVLSEVASSLSDMPRSLTELPRSLGVAMADVLLDEAGALWGESQPDARAMTLQELAACAINLMRDIRSAIAYGRTIAARGSTDFVSELVKVVKREVPMLSGRQFIFFLDDYTDERVPLVLQEALHPTVCQRSSDLCFKISAHTFGSIYHAPRPLALDEGRNITVINLGSHYLKLNKRTKEGRLLLDILNHRFKNCKGYDGTIEQWLGRTSFPGDVPLNRALHDPKTRGDVKYHGIECLMDLCTGDYSEMVKLVGEIFSEAGVEADSPVRQISPEHQDRAIQRVSREYLGLIRHIRPDGEKLYDVVNSFGVLSQRLLYERDLVGQGKDSRGRPRKDPFDLLTVYVDDLTKAAPAARQVWERLQKASIFIDIGLAPSQRRVIAERATLRRIYCPAFKTSLTSSEHLGATAKQFEWFMDMPAEFCKEQYETRVRKTTDVLFTDESLEEQDKTKRGEPVIESGPDDRFRIDFAGRASERWKEVVGALPALKPCHDVVLENGAYDIYIGAIGFEERTTDAAAALVQRAVEVGEAVLFEFDLYFKAAERRRDKYEEAIKRLTAGKPHRPMNAPISVQDSSFPQRMTSLLETLARSTCPKVLFDCTSCPSIIHSQALRVLLDFHCDLTILYSEADEYFPTRAEWEAGQAKPRGERVRGPFAGVRFVGKPPVLQSDDVGELPVLLILFPTFNTERTDGVLAEVQPAGRRWLFGEPHDMERNAYRVEMAKSFAARVMCPGDRWSVLSTFDYRASLVALGGIYAEHRFDHRFVIMPHGSKMQTLAVGLFAAVHDASMVFAMPKSYDPDRYSAGALQVWAVPLGKTDELVKKLRLGRSIRRTNGSEG